MTDIVLSSFLSLFALFGKEEQVDEAWAKTMLSNYLRHHFGIRNIDQCLNFYSDMRTAYEMSEDLNTLEVVQSICQNLHSNITYTEEAMLMLRVMEFCGGDGHYSDLMFREMAEQFGISDEIYQAFIDFINARESKYVMLHHLSETDGQLKTLLHPHSGILIFTYTGKDIVTLNDVPVLSGAYQVWLQSSVLKGKNGKPIYYSSIINAYNKLNGGTDEKIEKVEFCGRDINFRFPNSDNGMQLLWVDRVLVKQHSSPSSTAHLSHRKAASPSMGTVSLSLKQRT